MAVGTCRQAVQGRPQPFIDVHPPPAHYRRRCSTPSCTPQPAQVPKRAYTLQELRLNKIQPEQLLAPTDSTLSGVRNVLQVCRRNGGRLGGAMGSGRRFVHGGCSAAVRPGRSMQRTFLVCGRPRRRVAGAFGVTVVAALLTTFRCAPPSQCAGQLPGGPHCRVLCPSGGPLTARAGGGG